MPARFEYRPSLATCLQAVADARAYYEAQDVEIFLFGALADAGDEGELFADEVNPLPRAA